MKQHRNDVASTSKVEPCDICGDVGFPELIITCSECKLNREHRYCSRVQYLEDAPEVWFCQPCESKNATTSPCNLNQDTGLQAPKRQQTSRTGKVKFLDEDEVIKLASGSVAMTRKAYVGKLHKNLKTGQHAAHPSSKGPAKEHRHVSDRQVGALIRDKKVQFLNLQDQKPPKLPLRKVLTARMSKPITGSGAAAVQNIEKSNIQSIPEKFHYYHKHLPSSVCAWRGQFQILEAAASGEVYDGFEAQPPCLVNRKAHEISKKMPSVLQLEAFPASNVLTDVFPNDLQDIALYFFPSDSNERKSLNSIFELMDAEKSMLRSLVDGVELLIFTSSQLNEDSRGAFGTVYSEHFLWGVFRQNKIDNAIERLPDLVEPVDMDIDMIGGKDVLERIDHVQNEKAKSVDMDIDMIGGKDVLERMDHVQNEKATSLSKWPFEGTPLERTSSVKVKIEKDLITDSNEIRKKVSFGISANPPLWSLAKAKEYCKLFNMPDVPPGFEEPGYDRVKPPKYKRLDELK